MSTPLINNGDGMCFVRALLLTRVSEDALGGGRPQGGMPTAAGEEGEVEGRGGCYSPYMNRGTWQYVAELVLW